MAAKADAASKLAHLADCSSSPSSVSTPGLYAASDAQLKPLLQAKLTARLGMLLRDKHPSLLSRCMAIAFSHF
jgi:hypothetical protein